MKKRRASTGGFGGLHVLADDDPRWPLDPVAQARAAIAGGAAVVQLRCKHSTDREIVGWGRAIRALAERSRTTFLVNDRFDLALAVEADGVHLGQDDLPPSRVPEAARAHLAIGRSTHTAEQVAEASQEPVDYVAFGPVFGTTSKQSPYSARGLEALAEAAERVAPLPLVAIGGVEAGGMSGLARAGARGAAVLSAVAGARDPEAATRALARAFEDALATACEAHP